VIIADRLRALREEKGLSREDIENRTRLPSSYLSRVEDAQIVPPIEILEKIAQALEVPLYRLFYDSQEPLRLPNLPKRPTSDDIASGSSPRKPK